MAFCERIIGGKSRRILALGVLLAASVGAALAVPVAAPGAPESRRGTAPQHFKSGSERSLVILGEIRDTLKQIDARLQRIEQTVLTTANKEPARHHARPGDVR